MTIRTPIGFFVFLALLMVWGCLRGPVSYTPRDYVVVTATASDTLEGLAETYLNDSRKAWIIGDFNRIDTVSPGRCIIIPLTPFNLGGLTPDGCQLVPILAYDRLTEDPSGQGDTTELDFEGQMAYLRAGHYHVIGLARFLEFMNYNGQIPTRSVVITIDDTRLDAIERALPVLKKYGFTATLFVDTGKLGQPGMLTREDLVRLTKNGIDVQCRNGWDIDGAIETGQITLEQYFEQIRTEIPKARQTVEEITAAPCIVYACPPAGSNNLLVEFLKRTGFKAALVTNGLANPFYTDPFHIGRTRIPPRCSVDDFEEKLMVFRTMDIK
jgi:peptidoglycan/xylan/chitin deacetylase (PgdA/CDA1 family)